MGNATYFLNQAHYEFLVTNLPEPVAKTKRVIPNNELLGGILFVLRTGCRWQDIPRSICAHDYSSCWCRFNFWQHVLVLLDREGQIDLSLISTAHWSSRRSIRALATTASITGTVPTYPS